MGCFLGDNISLMKNKVKSIKKKRRRKQQTRYTAKFPLSRVDYVGFSPSSYKKHNRSEIRYAFTLTTSENTTHRHILFSPSPRKFIAFQ